MWKERLTIKHCLYEFSQCKDIRDKYNIEGDIKIILGRNCELGKVDEV